MNLPRDTVIVLLLASCTGTTTLSAHPFPASSQQFVGAQARDTQASAATSDSANPMKPQMERGQILMAEKRYDAAIHAYEDVLASQPKNAVILNMVGIAYLNLGNFTLAKKYFERAAKADKKYPSAVNNLGMVWYQQKNYRRAIREYQRAVAIDSGQAGTHANLGYAFYKVKKYPEAAGEFRKALEIDPHSFDRNDRVGTMVQDRTVENHGLFFFMMAKEYAQIGDAEHCADYLRKSLDEGYKDVAKARTDPAFKKVINDPTVQAVLLRTIPADTAVVPDSPRT